MRIKLLAALMAATIAAPTLAQRQETPEKRLDRIEQQLHAVQRKVFPQGAPQEITPEIIPSAPTAAPTGVAATTPVADLTARIDSLETQLRQLTGQAEENGHRLRLAEEAVTQLKEATASRLAALEEAEAARKQQTTVAAAAPASLPDPVPEAKPVRRASTAISRKKPSAPTDPDWVSARDTAAEPETAPAASAEAAYNEGFRLWEQKKYPEAIRKLEAVVHAFPGDRYASWAGNLAGRAYLDDGNAGAAAKALLANYEANPKGERAADSLYFLGQALLQLNKPRDACKAYDELRDVYGASLRDWVKQRLPAARAAAHCS
jgi:TolA-binding protein